MFRGRDQAAAKENNLKRARVVCKNHLRRITRLINMVASPATIACPTGLPNNLPDRPIRALPAIRLDKLSKRRRFKKYDNKGILAPFHSMRLVDIDCSPTPAKKMPPTKRFEHWLGYSVSKRAARGGTPFAKSQSIARTLALAREETVHTNQQGGCNGKLSNIQL
jgi:hypothetical protein